MVIGDGIYVQEGERPVDIQDLETVHFGDYSELRANTKGRDIMAHNITFKRIIDDDAFKYNHRVRYEFRLPYKPAKADSEYNPQTIEGHVFVWDGPNTRLDYGTGWQWNLNPWSNGYGTIEAWETSSGIERWVPVGFLEPDTSWHTVEAYLDFENNGAWFSIDDVRYEVELTQTAKTGWGREIAARLAAEIISIWPGETSGGAKHRAHFRNWVWVWEPIPELNSGK